jgi:LysR family transcriptional regulator of gallate degradation
VLGTLRRDHQKQDLTERMLFEDPHVILCRKEHRLARRRRQPGAADLAQSRWFAAPAGTPRRSMLERLFATLPHRPAIMLETASVAMVIATLTQSDCLALSSRQQAALDFSGAGAGAIFAGRCRCAVAGCPPLSSMLFLRH